MKYIKRNIQAGSRAEYKRLWRLAACIDEPRGRKRRGVQFLTPRQCEIMDLIVAGIDTNSEIGERLDMKPESVGKAVKGIVSRLGARSRIQAALIYDRHKRTPPPPPSPPQPYSPSCWRE